MDWLNFHHLRYFHVVAREGSIARAARVLHTSPPSISVQLKQLERSLGQPLFTRSGRQLALTAIGELVRDYAEQIFSLGSELLGAVRSDTPTRAPRLRVGVADSVAKELAARMLAPLFTAAPPVRPVVQEGTADQLLAELALHHLDLVLLDEPPPAVQRLKLFQHPLGDAGIGVFGTDAKPLRKRFPASLDGTPFVLPLENNPLRRAFDQFCSEQRLAVAIAAEVEDSGLAKTLAREGRGLLLAPTVLAPVLAKHYGLQRVGELAGMRVPYVACTVARRVDNPVVADLLLSARSLLGD
ncbi:MAG: LysR family transcriptional regulator [Planctomycetota bacterium]|nr:LysR family transcriptional regulator [Planctomycetota bacterium]